MESTIETFQAKLIGCNLKGRAIMGGATCSLNLFTILKVALGQRLGLGRFSSTSSPTCFARDYF